MPGGVTSIDGRLAVWVATHRYAPLNDVFVRLGTIDEIGAIWVVLALLVSLALWRRAVPAVGVAALTGLATGGADLLASGIKDLVSRPRPSITHPKIHPLAVVHSTSFPSGHATTAFAGAVILSYLVPRAMPAFAALAVAIAYSRVYIGVHYPGDVIAGAAIGSAVGVLATLLLRRAQRGGWRPFAHLTSRGTQVIARNG